MGLISLFFFIFSVIFYKIFGVFAIGLD